MSKELENLTFINTRPQEQAQELTSRLTSQGARVVEFPLIEIVEPESWESFGEALSQTREGDWFFFTSSNGVKFFSKGFQQGGLAFPENVRVAVIGEKTAKACKEVGIEVSFVSEVANGKALAEEFVRAYPEKGSCYLFRGDISDNKILEGLSVLGPVRDIIVYRNTLPHRAKDRLEEFKGFMEKADMMLITSSQAAKNLVQLCSPQIQIAVIGPKTAETVSELNLNLVLAAKSTTIESLVSGLVEFYSK